MSEAQDVSDQPELAAQWAGQSNPAEAPFAVRYITAIGDGCPLFSWNAGLSFDGDSFRVKFNRFNPEITPGEETAGSSCRLAVAVNVPVGYSFRVAQFAYHGYALLDEGVSAKLSTTYAFSRDFADAAELEATLTGPLDQDFEISDESSRDGPWSPCNSGTTQILNVHLETELSHDNESLEGEGMVEIDEAYGIQLKWGRCQGFVGGWDPNGSWDPNGTWNPNGNWNPNGTWNPNGNRNGNRPPPPPRDNNPRGNNGGNVNPPRGNNGGNNNTPPRGNNGGNVNPPRGNNNGGSANPPRGNNNGNNNGGNANTPRGNNGGNNGGRNTGGRR